MYHAPSGENVFVWPKQEKRAKRVKDDRTVTHHPQHQQSNQAERRELRAEGRSLCPVVLSAAASENIVGGADPSFVVQQY